MVTEFYNTDTCFYIPEHAGHITRAGNDLAVIKEAATTEIAGMSAQFAGSLDVASIFAIEVVDGANVVKATTGNVVSGGRVGASHDPT